ncbi:hypothetical protein K0A96_00425 [Patescibacteria group bacterium]|nr:hypothetical protein [Patescibacteria group bacterium]
MKNKQLVIIISSVLVVLLLAVAGWGFYAGYQVKTFAQEAEEMINKTSEWDKEIEETLGDAFDTDFTGMTEKYRSFESEANASIEKIDAMKTPAKAKDLQKDLREYYVSLAGLMSESVKIMEQLESQMAGLEESLTNLESLSEEDIEGMAEAMSEEEMMEMMTGSPDIEGLESMDDFENFTKDIFEKSSQLQSLERSILVRIGELKNVKFYLF